MPGYARIIPGYILLCLNVPKSVWIAFASHLHCNPLSKWTIDCFFWKVKIWIFSIVAESIRLCFLFLDWIFLQVRFQICCYFWKPKGPGAFNLNQPVRNPIDISMMFFYEFFIYFVVVFFFTFWYFKGVT